MNVVRAFAAVCLLGLGSCSYTFDVEAVMIGGRLAFIPDTASRSRAQCVTGVAVMPVQRSEPVNGETEEAASRRLYAWREAGGYDCADTFPVVYGVALRGTGAGDPEIPDVPPRDLDVGTLYEVSVIAGATGYGGGWFRLGPDGQVETFRSVPLGE